MNNKVEIFSGTGGVGKTTLAAARALYLADQGNKILLITIDPSKRLKQVLNIEDQSSGETVKVSWDFEHQNASLDAMLMNPEKTIARIANLSKIDDFKDNRIVKILARPNGGLNEILSLVELKLKLDENQYDIIILDTPPGSHFLDFLESSEKIESFFDKKFVEVFKFISDRESVKNKSRFALKLISTGVNKLIGYLEKVTGASFVVDFVESISVIYKTKDIFLGSLELKNKLKDSKYASWFLVTSTDQNKTTEALDLFKSAKLFFGQDATVLLNKCISDDVKNWKTSTIEQEHFKASILDKETNLSTAISNEFKNVRYFKEIIDNSPKNHIIQLKNQWN